MDKMRGVGNDTIWMNKNYHAASFRAIIDAFQNDSHNSQSVQLQDFLEKPAFVQLARDAAAAPRNCVAVSHMHIYDTLAPTKSMTAFEQFLSSPFFAGIVSSLAGKKIQYHSMQWFSFGHGQYTLLHDSLQQEPGLYLFFDCAQWNPEWGGFTSFIQDNEEVARILPRQNTATFISIGEGTRYFSRYVTHHAKRHRRILAVAIFK